jgi:hypothetical protein
MAKKATQRRAWTPEHLRELKTFARKKTPARRIAKALKRTEGATRQKAFSMGLSLDSRIWVCADLASAFAHQVALEVRSLTRYPTSPA